LAWAPDGQALYLASNDGTLAVARFEPGDLGAQLPDSDVQELMRRLGAGGAAAQPAGRRGVLAESAEQLELERGGDKHANGRVRRLRVSLQQHEAQQWDWPGCA
jgi:hypothetical protein